MLYMIAAFRDGGRQLCLSDDTRHMNGKLTVARRPHHICNGL